MLSSDFTLSVFPIQAMRLIQLCQAGEMLPPTLPASIIPPAKKGGAVGGLTPSLTPVLRPSPSPSPTPLAPASSPPLTRKQVYVYALELRVVIVSTCIYRYT